MDLVNGNANLEKINTVSQSYRLIAAKLTARASQNLSIHSRCVSLIVL